MKAEIAVATVSGKAYYVIVSELKKKNIPFLSLTPNEPVPIEVKLVITTATERHLVNHDKILVYQDGKEPEAIVNEALHFLRGKQGYEKVVIGIDPGDVFGLAVLADGKVIKTGNCFSIEQALNSVKSTLKNLENIPIASILVKIGDGVAECKERLLRVLDNALPSDVMLESVSEAGTNRYLSETKHRRGERDIVSAIKIAGRNGRPFLRRRTDESDG